MLTAAALLAFASLTSAASLPRATLAHNAPAGWSYVGCRGEPANGRILSTRISADSNNSPNTCTASCAAAGYSYAGVEYGNECWCGNALNQPTVLDESKCTIPCAGNAHTVCGAGYVMNLYQKTSAPSPGPTGWTEVGCYVDQSARTLNGPSTVNPSGMTQDACTSYCTGYTYAGIENSKECYCSNSLTVNIPAPSTDCNAPCAGNPNEICGGYNWRLSLFQAGSGNTPAPTYKKVGCVVDSATRVLGYSPSNAPSQGWVESTCTAACQAANYSFSGLEASRECWCGSGLPFSDKGSWKADSECNTPCAADPSQTCGGNWRLQAYQRV